MWGGQVRRSQCNNAGNIPSDPFTSTVVEPPAEIRRKKFIGVADGLGRLRGIRQGAARPNGTNGDSIAG